MCLKKSFAILLAAATLFCGLGGGFFLGRRFPAHHYEAYRTGPLLLDTTTGHLCVLRELEPKAALDPNTSSSGIPFCNKE
jgi:hypothetical protein